MQSTPPENRWLRLALNDDALKEFKNAYLQKVYEAAEKAVDKMIQQLADEPAEEDEPVAEELHALVMDAMDSMDMDDLEGLLDELTG